MLSPDGGTEDNSRCARILARPRVEGGIGDNHIIIIDDEPPAYSNPELDLSRFIRPIGLSGY